MTQPRHTQPEGEPLALPTARVGRQTRQTQANQATAKKLKHFIWFIKFHIPKVSFKQG